MTDPTAALAADYGRLLAGLHDIAAAVTAYATGGASARDALHDISEVLDRLRQGAAAGAS